MLLIGLFYIIVPLILILVTALVRKPDSWSWALSFVAFGVVMLFLWTTARWDIVGTYLRFIYPILYLIASFVGFKRIKKPLKPTPKISIVVGVIVNILLIIFMSVLSGLSLKGYSTPPAAVELASPLRDQPFVVLHGGSSPFINAHSKIRPQNYALDLVGHDAMGKRAKSIAGGSELTDYAIFGQTVYSPCSGKVLLVQNGLEDLIPPKTDVENLAGNHVLIDCGDFEVLLAHLKHNSVKVEEGDELSVDSVIGQVGNTGNTSEPHLHIHAEKGGEENTILNGNGVPFTINGDFLVRGSIVNE